MVAGQDGIERTDPSSSTTTRRRQFELVVDQVGRGLTQSAFLLCRDRDRAEDLVGEALVNTWPRWRDGKIEDLAPYLRRTVINLSYKSQRHRIVVQRHEALFVSLLPTDRSDDRTVTRIDLVQAMLRLPLSQRAVLVLRYFEDMTEAEVSAALGISAGTVKSRMARGLATLRKTYGRRVDV